MAYALTEEPIVLDLCQKRGFFASCRVPYARRMPASTFAIAGCEASKPCPAIRCAAVIAATRRLRVATTPAFEGSIIRIVEGFCGVVPPGWCRCVAGGGHGRRVPRGPRRQSEGRDPETASGAPFEREFGPEGQRNSRSSRSATPRIRQPGLAQWLIGAPFFL